MARTHSFIVDTSTAGRRLDHALVRCLPGQTRSALGRLITGGHALVNGQRAKAGYRLRVDDQVEVRLPPEEPRHLEPEAVEFNVLFEDDALLIIGKPPGLVVHPAAGHQTGTLAHGLLHHCQELPGTIHSRPGIVHRLDMDTSGIMLIAKTEPVLRQLMQDFKNRSIDKTYHAILARTPSQDQGRLIAPIGRHPVHRKKMAVREAGGRYAATRWRILEQHGQGTCLAEIDLETGRTHQIRVHMASLGAPVLGDRLYGRPSGVPGCERQMLHASTLVFTHPKHGERMSFSAPLWPDMQAVLEVLRGER